MAKFQNVSIAFGCKSNAHEDNFEKPNNFIVLINYRLNKHKLELEEEGLSKT